MFAPPPEDGYTSEPLAADGQRMAPGTADFERSQPKAGGSDRRAAILAGVLGGANRSLMVSDAAAKKAAFIEGLNYAHETAKGEPGKEYRMPDYVRGADSKPSTPAPEKAPEKKPEESYVSPRMQGAINHPATQAVARALMPSLGFGYMGAIEGGQMGVQYAKRDETQSDEHTKNVLSPDQIAMRDGSSDPRTNSFDKTFHRDTRAEQVSKGKAYKRASEDAAAKDADAMMAGFGASLDRGASVKPSEGYVPDVEMYAGMKAMKPSLYAYKPEFKPGEQVPGELQVGPMANPMAEHPVTATALVKDPNTGLLAIDKDKALKLSMGAIATLAEDVEDLKRKRKGGRK